MTTAIIIDKPHQTLIVKKHPVAKPRGTYCVEIIQSSLKDGGDPLPIFNTCQFFMTAEELQTFAEALVK
jgi:hypothetical protein